MPLTPVPGRDPIQLPFWNVAALAGLPVATNQNRITGYFRNFTLLIGKELIHLIMLVLVSLAPDEIVTKTL